MWFCISIKCSGHNPRGWAGMCWHSPFWGGQIPVCSGEEHCALSMFIPCWEHRPELRPSFALRGVERIWQLVPFSQPCSPSHGITANIQTSRILHQFLWVWLSSSLLALCTQQLDVSWQGGSPGGRFSAFSNYSAAVNDLMPTGSGESSEQLPSCAEMKH